MLAYFRILFFVKTSSHVHHDARFICLDSMTHVDDCNAVLTIFKSHLFDFMLTRSPGTKYSVIRADVIFRENLHKFIFVSVLITNYFEFFVQLVFLFQIFYVLFILTLIVFELWNWVSIFEHFLVEAFAEQTVNLYDWVLIQ